MTEPALATRIGLELVADPRRVIVKLFVPGEDDAIVRNRATALIRRIADLDPAESARQLQETLDRFGGRHCDLEGVFDHHYELIHHRVGPSTALTPTARLLVGAYFSHEYSVEAAALCNPSIVPHPDQSGLDDGQLRTVLSFRQIGEGHLSSIGFGTAVVGPGDRLELDTRSGPLVAARRGPARSRRALLAAGLADEGCDDAVSATVLGSLPERFTEEEFEHALVTVPGELLARVNVDHTIEQLRRAMAASYTLDFPTLVPLAQRVLWPAAAAECNGMEDVRFVKTACGDGEPSYRATYTAYDGRNISGRMLSTDDFLHFEVDPLRGPGARNKGVAIFPRPVGGRQLALCRADGETLGLTTLDEDHQWQLPVLLHAPRQPWELIQVGNCGSPLETDAGWLVITHGVGAMRRYVLGALLLDLHQPDQVIAELPRALLEPDESEREGYVPNVVYSCGGLIHQDMLWLPYGASDARVGFATIDVSSLLGAMRPVA